MASYTERIKYKRDVCKLVLEGEEGSQKRRHKEKVGFF
jgi:hypothetical protein